MPLENLTDSILCNIMHSMITVEIINLLRVGYNREIEFFQGIYVFGQT